MELEGLTKGDTNFQRVSETVSATKWACEVSRGLLQSELRECRQLVCSNRSNKQQDAKASSASLWVRLMCPSFPSPSPPVCLSQSACQLVSQSVLKRVAIEICCNRSQQKQQQHQGPCQRALTGCSLGSFNIILHMCVCVCVCMFSFFLLFVSVFLCVWLYSSVLIFWGYRGSVFPSGDSLDLSKCRIVKFCTWLSVNLTLQNWMLSLLGGCVLSLCFALLCFCCEGFVCLKIQALEGSISWRMFI